MSGHNKWSKIKHKKAKTDAAKSAGFTKVIREIMSAVKQGGADISGNFKLRMAIEHAKEVNLPNSNIESAIKKGAAKDAAILEEITYEAYGPGGVAMLIETMTDNRNRTVGEVRHAVERTGGKFAASGAVSWMFDKKGFFLFEPGQTSEEKLMDFVIDAGADDIVTSEDQSVEVYCAAENFEKVRQALDAQKLTPVSSELGMFAKEEVEVSDAEISNQLSELIEKLEELDDVQKVYTNHYLSANLENS